MNTSNKAILAVAIVAILAVSAIGAGLAYTAQTSNSNNAVGDKYMILDQGNAATAFTDAYVNKIVWNTEQYVDTSDNNTVKVKGDTNSTVNKGQTVVYDKITGTAATGKISEGTKVLYLGTDSISLTNYIDDEIAKIPAHTFEVTSIENLSHENGFTYYIDITTTEATGTSLPTANTLKLQWDTSTAKWVSTEADGKIDAALDAKTTAAAETVYVSLYVEDRTNVALGSAGTYVVPQPDDSTGIGLTYVATISDDKAHVAA